jgi:hypothetical protein
MKISAKHIKQGMQIQYAGHREFNGKLSASCGTVKKNSPVVEVVSVEDLAQEYHNLKGIMVRTACGLEITFSTRQKVLIR